MKTFVGLTAYNQGGGEPLREHTFATTGEHGIAQFLRSALLPLEGQGRGSAHGHQKRISVLRMSAARLKHRLVRASATEHSEDELI